MFAVQLPIVNHVVNYPYQFVRVGEAEGFFPEALRFIANDDDGCVVVFGLDVLA